MNVDYFWQLTSEECCFPSSLRRILVSTILRGLRDHVADQVQLSPHALIVPFLFSCNTLICKLRRRTVLLSAKLHQIAIDHNLFDIHLLEASQSRTTETLNIFSSMISFGWEWALIAGGGTHRPIASLKMCQRAARISTGLKICTKFVLTKGSQQGCRKPGCPTPQAVFK